MNDFQNIVVLGGGFGGVVTALELEKSLPFGFKLFLIDKVAFQSFHTVLYEVATAVMPKERKIDFKNLSGTANIDHLQIFKNKRIKLIHNQIEDINLIENQIILSHGQKVEYSYLVFALGSQTEYYSIEGAENYATGFKTTEDVLNFRNNTEEFFYNEKKTAGSVKIVIVGGGATGCELAAELCGFLKKLALKHNTSFKNNQITLIEAQDTLLLGSSNWLKKSAKKRLNLLGINLITSCAVSKVEPNLVITMDGAKIEFDILVWTAGVRAPAFFKKIQSLPTEEKKGSIKTENDLRIFGFDNLFAIGDNSFCYKYEKGYPQTAQVAIAQAKLAAKNIIANISGQKMLDFEKKSHPFIVPLGGKWTLADLEIVKLKGFFGWVVKKLVELKYLIMVLPVVDAFKIWLKGLVIYQYND
jgi:NADH dehydrogenase